MEQPDMRIGSYHNFSVELQNHAQNTVRGRMLRTEI
jgi:hypothetical protein